MGKARRAGPGVRPLFVLFGVAEAAILPFFPLLLRDRGLGSEQVGLVLSAMALAGFLANPAWGYVADARLGSEKALTLTAAAAALVAPLLLLGGWAPLFVGLALVLAVFRAPVAALTDVIALDYLGSRRGEYGRVRLWMSASFALAAVGWGLLLQQVGLSSMLGAYGVSILAISLWTGLVMKGGGAARAALEGRHLLRARRVLSESRDLLIFLLELLMVGVAFVAAWNFVALRIADVGGGPPMVGVAAGIQAAAEIPVMRWSPRLIPRIGESGVFVAGYILYAVGFGSWAFLSDPLLIALVRVLVGVGFALVYVGSVLIVDGLVPRHLRATGQGLAKAVMLGVAPIVGTLAGGIVYGTAGPGALFLLTATLSLGAAVSHRFCSSARRPSSRVAPGWRGHRLSVGRPGQEEPNE